MARLNGIQQSLISSPSTILVDLEKMLQWKLDLVLTQEDELQTLKFRINWMVFGDRNTSFYHLSTIVRRKRNWISTMKNNVGDWLYDKREVMNYIRKSFMELYTTSHSQASWNSKLSTRQQTMLTEEESGSLDGEVSDEEIKATLWSLKATKASRSDGFHVGFFQCLWLVVGDSIKVEVKRVFAEKKILDYLNKTQIAFIPKMQGPETIGNYRPINYVTWFTKQSQKSQWLD